MRNMMMALALGAAVVPAAAVSAQVAPESPAHGWKFRQPGRSRASLTWQSSRQAFRRASRPPVLRSRRMRRAWSECSPR